MQQSNTYVMLYALAISVICGGLLAFASGSLKERQLANIAHAKKKSILSTVMELKEGDDVEALYAEKIKAFVVDHSGKPVEGILPEDVNIALEFKKEAKERMLPVYEYGSNGPAGIEAVVLPVYGNGLWKNIWGFIALDSDLNTVGGVKFEHAGETPGLGARMTSDDIQNRYTGKQVFDNGTVVSVVMQKGEGFDYSDDTHKVDGMSGATLTANGINDMLKDYLLCYQSYIENKLTVQNP